MEQNIPLVIVFYLDRQLMSNPEIIKPFAESINDTINIKNMNVLALFLPTDDVERVECINPVMLKEADIEKIQTLIDDIKKKFSIDSDIKLSEDASTKEMKICDCHNNDGKCNCE